jgi:organizing structure protein 2
VRQAVTGALCNVHSHVQGYVSRWIAIEHAIEGTSYTSRGSLTPALTRTAARVKSLVSPQEPLTPGVLYVGVATLSGSIIARNRTLAVRLLLPPSLFMLTMHHFLPRTTHNLSAYLASLEEAYFPTFAEKHRTGVAHTRMTVDRIREQTREGREALGRGVESAVRSAQGFTGLKIRDGLGWGPDPTGKGAVESRGGDSKADPASGAKP